ncbi:winged helix-turn-helix domain-containing protein [Litoribacillus peritrichatus]|uniref:OmpR/PhoB-type domain-containing protein n=1 Tax=Litoribacillus peritrichatus TaxID=718191 RepID=A0ABP7MEC5_9GAMM
MQNSNTYTFNDFQFDTQTGELTRAGADESVFLREKLRQLLRFFVENQKRVIPKEELLDALWEHGKFREKSLSQSILELRKALGDSSSAPQYIRTIPNQGYQWVCDNTAQIPPDTPLVCEPEKVKPNKSRVVIAVSVLFVLSLLVFVFAVQQTTPGTQITNDRMKVLILPFKNGTHTTSMNWVEYGLSDMMAGDFLSIEGVKTTPPTQVPYLFSDLDLDAVLATGDYSKLFLISDFDVIIAGEVELTPQHQVLNYQLVYQEGEIKKGRFERSDLAVVMPDLVSALYQQIHPKKQQVALPPYNYVPSAMHEYARGIQSLQNKGSVLAQHYFAASVQIDPTHLWSKAYLGVCQLYLGEWTTAKTTFKSILGVEDPSLLAFSHYWLAVLSFREGLLEDALVQLEQSISQLQHTSNTVLFDDINNLKLQIHNIQIASQSDDADAVTSLLLSDNTNTRHQKDPSHELIKLSADESLKVASLERITRQGYLPLLSSVLLQKGGDVQLNLNERDNYYARAIEILKQLNQPYELSIAWMLRAELHKTHDSERAHRYLAKAKILASELNAGLLQEQIRLWH